MQPATKLSLWHGGDASCGERERERESERWGASQLLSGKN